MRDWPAHAVVLPGTGSDAQFAEDAFGAALHSMGTITTAVEPDPTGIVASYEHALDAAASTHGRIIVGGISIGAAVALSWALRHPDHVFGVLAALPPWLGAPDDAPAALSARFTSEQLINDGLDAVMDAMTASSPPWLATTLGRSWVRQWPHLPSALAEAAAYEAPNIASLRRVQVPTAVVGAMDDPVHPFTVAETWRREIPQASLSAVTLADIGADPAILGERAVFDLYEKLDQPPNCCMADPDDPRRGPSDSVEAG